MKKLITAILGAMMIAVLVFALGCKKKSTEPDNNGGGGGGNNPTQNANVCFGFIGFNDSLFIRDISALDTMWHQDFRDFLNETWPDERTKLLFSEWTALDMLQSATAPANLTNVSLVTYINGLDRVSLDDTLTNPQNFTTNSLYVGGLVNRIFDTQINGVLLDSYVIGHVNDDVQNNMSEFRDVMHRLSTEDENVHEVNDLAGVSHAFRAIADSIKEKTGTGNGKIVQDIILNQGSNLSLLHGSQILYH